MATLTALESFNPDISQAANWGRSRQRVGPVTQLASTMSPYSAQSNYGKTIEQLQHFTYWNYLAVDLIAMRCSEPTPMLSFKTSMVEKIEKAAKAGRDPKGVTQSLDKRHREWIQEKYHVCQSSQDDMDPIPETHPLAKIIETPNDEDTWNQFVYEHFLFLGLTGMVYWWVIPNGFGLPAQVAVIPTQWVRPDINKDGFVYQYSVVPDGGSYRLLELPPEQVAYGMMKNPRNKRWGYSPIEAAPYWTANAESIEISRNSSFTQGVNPDVIMKMGDKYSIEMAEDVITRIKEKFMKRASGVKRAGEPLFVPPDIEVEKWSNTPKDMDYGTTGDIARDTNLALHKTPKVMFGITTDINRATIEGANVLLAQNALNPKLTHLAGMLTKHLGKPFDPRIVCWYKDITPNNHELELAQDTADFAMGALTPDEQRQKRGRKSVGEPAYESGYLPAGLHPISEEMAQIATDREAEAMAAETEMMIAAAAAKGGNDQPQGSNSKGNNSSKGSSEKPPAKAATEKAGKKQSALPSMDSLFTDETDSDE